MGRRFPIKIGQMRLRLRHRLRFDARLLDANIHRQVARKGKRSFPVCKKPRRSMCVHLNGQWLVRPLSLHGRTRRLPRWRQHSPPGDFCRETFLRAIFAMFATILFLSRLANLSRLRERSGEEDLVSESVLLPFPASCWSYSEICSLSFARWCLTWKRWRNRNMSRFRGKI